MDVLLATCRELPEPDDDAPLLLEALARRGVATAVAAWDDPGVDWSRARLSVLRSTWNYHLRLEAFLSWARRVAATTRLWNPLEVVEWNVHKRYLLDLERQGVPIVPTRLVERGGSLDLAELARAWPRMVVKPAVSAASFATVRAEAGSLDAAQRHLDELLRSRDVLVQRYLPSVEDHGERSLVHVEGELTHAVRKRPRFGGGCESVSGTVAIAADEGRAARTILEALPWPLLYARVDLARDERGTPVLMELELIEPSLFLAHDRAALERLADAIAARAGC